MFSDIFLNPKIYDKKERRDKIISLSVNNIIYKNKFNGFNYSILKKEELFKKENIFYFKNYIKKIKIPIYEVLTYDVLTKFYLDCEMEVSQQIYEKKDKLFLNFNNYLLDFLNKKYPGREKELLYADSSRLKENNYKLSLHVVVNKLGYFNRILLHKVVLEFIQNLPHEFYKNGKSFVDDGVYHGSQLMRIIYSPNLQNNSVLKPFIIEDNKIINKDIEYISNNYEKGLCGNYNVNFNKLEEIIENNEEIKENNTEIPKINNIRWIENNTLNDIPEWKINWIKNSNYIKNIYAINNIEKNIVDLKRINFNTYCKLCKRNHERENAFCKVYKNNIMFYCNRNKKGITIGSWYNVRDDSIKNYDIIDKIKIENKLLKEKIKELENQIIDLKLKKRNNIDYNISIDSKWYKYYDCGKLIVENKFNEFKNIISQVWKDGNVSKLKNRCLRIYELIEYMKKNRIKTVKTTIRNIFHLPNWEFDYQLKNNNFF